MTIAELKSMLADKPDDAEVFVWEETRAGQVRYSKANCVQDFPWGDGRGIAIINAEEP